MVILPKALWWVIIAIIILTVFVWRGGTGSGPEMYSPDMLFGGG
jgi:hypothetical protein